MKITIETDSLDEAKTFVNMQEARRAINEFSEKLRSIVKYEEHSEEVHEAYFRVRELWWECFSEVSGWLD